MTNVVPGFVWHPIDVSGRARRAKGRGLIAHVAVSESTNLVPPGTPATRSADWHFYLPKSGPGIQYIDLDYQCWSSAGANATCPAFESQGGVNSPQTEPWTANQIELAAQILAHLHRTEGTPLQVMPNSLPSSKGIGPHRWGINPWRVPGGEVWSSSNGKVCPGDAKVAQLPQIVARATQIVNGSPAPLPASKDDDMAVIYSPGRGSAVVGPGYFRFLSAEEAANPGPFGAAVVGNDRQWDLWKSMALSGQFGAQVDEMHTWLRGGDPNHDNIFLLWAMLTKLTEQEQSQAPALDETKLAAALLADPAGVGRLGAAIAAHLKLTSS